VAYPDELLVPGEEIIMHKHPHWKMLILPVLVLLVVVAVVSYLAAVIGAQSWSPWARLVLGVIGLGLVVRFTLAPVIRWRTTHFVVTNRRVLVREGLITRRGMDIPMRRITGVEFRQGLLERLLGVGTLVIESPSEDALEFRDIPGVESAHALLYQEVAKGT
jgi:membrane protein YdbS with pleckstrin-like domain